MIKIKNLILTFSSVQRWGVDVSHGKTVLTCKTDVLKEKAIENILGDFQFSLDTSTQVK